MINLALLSEAAKDFGNGTRMYCCVCFLCPLSIQKGRSSVTIIFPLIFQNSLSKFIVRPLFVTGGPVDNRRTRYPVLPPLHHLVLSEQKKTLRINGVATRHNATVGVDIIVVVDRARGTCQVNIGLVDVRVGPLQNFFVYTSRQPARRKGWQF